jgi:hypothetical protein
LQVDRGLADLVMGMLRLDASQRLTAAAALLHPFFDAVSPMRALMQVLPVAPISARLLKI